MIMKAKIEERLSSLKAEYDNGQKMLSEIDARRKSVSDTLLRIEGAMAVLKELAEEENKTAAIGASNGAVVKDAAPVAAA